LARLGDKCAAELLGVKVIRILRATMDSNIKFKKTYNGSNRKIMAMGTQKLNTENMQP
jgi:hypothetical protein